MSSVRTCLEKVVENMANNVFNVHHLSLSLSLSLSVAEDILFWLMSQIEAQRNMVDFVMDSHCHLLQPGNFNNLGIIVNSQEIE